MLPSNSNRCKPLPLVRLASLEVWLDKEGCSLKRKKRRLGKTRATPKRVRR